MDLDKVKIDIKTFCNGLKKLEKLNKDYFVLGDVVAGVDDLTIINKSIELRNLVNEARGVTSIDKYKREDSFNVDLKGMLGEIMVSKMLLNFIKNGNHSREITVKSPSIAEFILDKTTQDFKIIDSADGQDFCFDVKSQDSTSSKLNINVKSFQRMLEQSKFFLVCYIQNIDALKNNSNSKVTLIYISNKYFKENAKYIDMSHKYNRTDFYSLDLNKIFK